MNLIDSVEGIDGVAKIKIEVESTGPVTIPNLKVKACNHPGTKRLLLISMIHV